MKKDLSMAVSLLLLLNLLSGCMDGVAVETPSATPEPTPTLSGDASITPQPTPGAADDVLTLDPSQEPPLPDEILAIPVPEFLTEEQQLLYRKAYHMYSTLFGASTALVETMGGSEDFTTEFIADPETGAHLATGKYSRWADFDAVVHSVFTDRFWQEKNQIVDYYGENATPIYVEKDGSLYYQDISFATSINRNRYFPDTFELIQMTDEAIEFYVVAYYSDPFVIRDGQTLEERLKSSYNYIEKFPIRMVREESGWRFDEFHTGWLDSAA